MFQRSDDIARAASMAVLTVVYFVIGQIRLGDRDEKEETVYVPIMGADVICLLLYFKQSILI